MMHRHSVKFFLIVISILMPAALFAQNTRLNGLWVAPYLSGHGPSFWVYTFQVNGGTFTGGIAKKGDPADPLTDGKIENGHITFAMPKEENPKATIETSYTGTLKDDRHLDLDGETRMTSNLIRKAGTKSSPNAFEGEWVFDWAPQWETFTFHVNGDKLTGEVFEVAPEWFKKIEGKQSFIFPLIDGKVHGNEISFGYVGQYGGLVLFRITLEGDHLVMHSYAKQTLHLTRIADSPSNSVVGRKE